MNPTLSAVNLPLCPAPLPGPTGSQGRWPRRFILLAASLAITANARGQTLFEYGSGEVTHSGAIFTGNYQPVDVYDITVPGWVTKYRPIFETTGISLWAGEGRQEAAGLSRFSYSYANPAGGRVSVELDVPGGAIHSSITAPPQLRIWDPTRNRYEEQSGYGSAQVGFQDKITIHGPSLAAYQYIPITLIAHLDGSMTAGTSAGGTDLDVARVNFYAGLLAAPNSSLGGAGTTGFQEELHSGATANYDRDFVLHGEIGPQTSGGLISMWLTTSLRTTVGNGGTADFLNTARYELVLPEGYTYTSTMEFASAVPEPADAALMAGFGLLGIGAWHWARGSKPSKR